MTTSIPVRFALAASLMVALSGCSMFLRASSDNSLKKVDVLVESIERVQVETVLCRDRMEGAIRDHADRPPQEIIGAMHAGILAFTSGTPQDDDLTAVIVKRVS